MMVPRNVRAVRETVLIVGEGYADYQFLRHIRSLYTSNQQGSQMTVGNARGKGAANVVDYAVRLARQASYDRVGALLDTDTDWTPAVQRKARSARITTLPSVPCIECWLLEVVGQHKQCDTEEHKYRFKQTFGGDAHQDGLIAGIFKKDVLDAARPRVAVLDKLLLLLKV